MADPSETGGGSDGLPGAELRSRAQSPMGDDGGTLRRGWARRPRSRGAAEMRADVLDDGRIRTGSDQAQPDTGDAFVIDGGYLIF